MREKVEKKKSEVGAVMVNEERRKVLGRVGRGKGWVGWGLG